VESGHGVDEVLGRELGHHSVGSGSRRRGDGATEGNDEDPRALNWTGQLFTLTLSH
jgi:hypothetical protein